MAGRGIGRRFLRKTKITKGVEGTGEWMEWIDAEVLHPDLNASCLVQLGGCPSHARSAAKSMLW